MFFYFGLVLDSAKDNENGNFDESKILLYTEIYESNWGVTKLIKGPPRNTNYDNWEKKSLEVRINLQSRLLRVGAQPNYESVVQANNPDKIDPNKCYRLFFSGLN